MTRSSHPSPHEIARTVAGACLSMRTRFLNRSINAIYDEAYRDLGITAAQGNILVATVLNADLSPTRLGQVLNIEKSTLSRNLDRMAKAGLIDILEPETGRTNTLRATRKGKDLLRKMLPRWQSAEESTRDLLTRTGAAGLKRAADIAREKLVSP